MQSTVWLLAGLAVIGALIYLVLFTFVPPGQLLGQLLQEHPQVIRAYSLNVAGSLAGVWLFEVMCSASFPAIWFVAAGLLALATMGVRGRHAWAAVGLFICAAY